jgi:hypothetical protein
MDKGQMCLIEFCMEFKCASCKRKERFDHAQSSHKVFDHQISWFVHFLWIPDSIPCTVIAVICSNNLIGSPCLLLFFSAKKGNQTSRRHHPKTGYGKIIWGEQDLGLVFGCTLIDKVIEAPLFFLTSSERSGSSFRVNVDVLFKVPRVT